jgi:alpha-1,2-mannosyltransferase
LRRAFGAAPWMVALLWATYTPVLDHAVVGQADLLVLFLLLAGAAWTQRWPWAGGALLGAAAMCKMSPALLLLYWARRRELRPVLAAIACAAALTVLALPLVRAGFQLRFYAEVLPGFGAGHYHGLDVPIAIPNHSIPALFNRIWPGPAPSRLSPAARWASGATTLLLLGAWTWRTRRAWPEPLALGTLTVLMVTIPVYAFEHHLVFLLLALGAAGTARPGASFALAYGALALPLVLPVPLIDRAVRVLPSLQGWILEAKFAATMGLLALCMADDAGGRCRRVDKRLRLCGAIRESGRRS